MSLIKNKYTHNHEIVNYATCEFLVSLPGGRWSSTTALIHKILSI